MMENAPQECFAVMCQLQENKETGKMVMPQIRVSLSPFWAAFSPVAVQTETQGCDPPAVGKEQLAAAHRMLTKHHHLKHINNPGQQHSVISPRPESHLTECSISQSAEINTLEVSDPERCGAFVNHCRYIRQSFKWYYKSAVQEAMQACKNQPQNYLNWLEQFIQVGSSLDVPIMKMFNIVQKTSWKEQIN